MAVGHDETACHAAGNLSGVLIHLDLADGVNNGITIGIIPVQTLESTRPVIFGVQSQTLISYRSIVRQQIDSNAVGALAVLVIGIFPALCHRNINSRGSMAVSHSEARCHTTGNLSSVLIHLDLADSVSDFVACSILGQVGENTRPVVVCIQGQALASCHIVGQQVDSNAVGTHAVLIVGVIPYLFDRNINHGASVGQHSIARGYTACTIQNLLPHGGGFNRSTTNLISNFFEFDVLAIRIRAIIIQEHCVLLIGLLEQSLTILIKLIQNRGLTCFAQFELRPD